ETVDAIDASGMMQQASVMRLQVRVVEFTDGTLRYGRDAKYSEDIAPVLRETLHRHTGKRWAVEEVPGGDGAPSLVEVAEAERDAAAAATRAHPLVRAALDTFPEAELIEDGGASSQRREIPWSRKA
ncbi:MAG TPA: DNA polymerase III subunit gamma/tau, partial [Erythrobacter sp.]|nr:DNA polymerase III subunit gamma/tau [Erythrobacter sp.]HBM05917.1 DNA polymerase III subunit gamma/tau [Erythrobacter sp.]